MVRKSPSTHRKPGPTENEIALQWEISRLRAELVQTRKSMGANEFGEVPGDRLEGESRARLYEKIGRMTRHWLAEWVGADERCAECGGVGPAQHEAAFVRAAADIRAALADDSPAKAS